MADKEWDKATYQKAMELLYDPDLEPDADFQFFENLNAERLRYEGSLGAGVGETPFTEAGTDVVRHPWDHLKFNPADTLDAQGAAAQAGAEDADEVLAEIQAGGSGSGTERRGADWLGLEDLEVPAPPPQVSQTEAGLLGAEQGATMGFSDEAMGAGAAAATPAVKAGLTGLASMASPVPGMGGLISGAASMLPEAGGGSAADAYTQGRDVRRGEQAAAQEAHPGVYMGGELGGGLLPMAATMGMLPPGAASPAGTTALKALGHGAKAGAKAGAAEGTVAGLGLSEADSGLGMLGDVALGAGGGAAFGGAFGGLMQAGGQSLWNMLTRRGARSGELLPGSTPVQQERRFAETAGAQPAAIAPRGLKAGEFIEDTQLRAVQGEPFTVSAAELAAKEGSEVVARGAQRTLDEAVGLVDAPNAYLAGVPSATADTAAAGGTLAARPGSMRAPWQKRGSMEEVVSDADMALDKAMARDGSVLDPGRFRAASDVRKLFMGADGTPRQMDAQEMAAVLKRLDEQGKIKAKAGRSGGQQIYLRAAAKVRKVLEDTHPEFHDMRQAQSVALERMKDSLELLGLPREAGAIRDLNRAGEFTPDTQKIFTKLLHLEAEGGVSARNAVAQVLQDDPKALDKVLNGMGLRSFERLTGGDTAKLYFSPGRGGVRGTMGLDVPGGPFGIGHRMSAAKNLSQGHGATAATMTAQTDMLLGLMQAFKGEETE